MKKLAIASLAVNIALLCLLVPLELGRRSAKEALARSQLRAEQLGDLCNSVAIRLDHSARLLDGAVPNAPSFETPAAVSARIFEGEDTSMMAIDLCLGRTPSWSNRIPDCRTKQDYRCLAELARLASADIKAETHHE